APGRSALGRARVREGDRGFPDVVLGGGGSIAASVTGMAEGPGAPGRRDAGEMNVPEARSSEVETMLTKRKPSAASSARRQKVAATESRHTPSPAQAGPREPSSTLSHRREPSS